MKHGDGNLRASLTQRLLLTMNSGKGLLGAPIGVVVVNYGSHELISVNLAPQVLSDVPAQVIIVDNYSSESEQRAIAALASQRGWSLVTLGENQGFGAAVNVGVAEALRMGCECILLLNPDAVASSGVISQLRTECLAQPMALITPRITDSNGNPYFQGSWLDLIRGRTRGTAPSAAEREFHRPWLTGAYLAFHRQLWHTVGLFDTAYFLYWEDVDYSYRALEAGATLIVRQDLVAIHDEGGTQARTGRARSNIYYYYNCRNRLLFAARHFSRRGILRWALCSPRESWQILMRGGKRQLLYSPRPLAAATLGTLSGVGLVLQEMLRRDAGKSSWL